MNKAYKYTLTANEHKEITFDVGVNRLAISNANGTDGDVTVVTSEITKTDSGEICSFVDGADAPFADLKVNIEAVQSGSGDPSPTNVRPITGWTGANLTDTGKNIFDGNLSVDTTPINDILKDGATYTVTGDIVNSSQNTYLQIWQYDKGQSTPTNIGSVLNGTSKFPRTFMADLKNYDYALFVVNQTSLDNIKNVQIELGTTATTYEPYNGNTYNINWQSIAGTVYGGTLDVVNDTLTVDRAMVDLGTLTWGSMSQNRYVANLDNCKATAGNYADFYSEMFTPKAQIANGNCWINSGKLYVVDTDHTTISDFLNFASGTHICYELATPITYQLTPTEIRSLLGVNNVWADCGSINLKYFVQSTQPLIDYINDEDDRCVYIDCTQSGADTFSITSDITKAEFVSLLNKNKNVKLRLDTGSGDVIFDLSYVTANIADFTCNRTVLISDVNSFQSLTLRVDMSGDTLSLSRHAVITIGDGTYEYITGQNNQMIKDGWTWSTQGYDLRDADELLFMITPMPNVASDNDTINGEMQRSSQDPKRALFCKGIKNMLPDVQEIESPFWFNDIVVVGNRATYTSKNDITMKIRVWANYYSSPQHSLADVNFYANCDCNDSTANLWGMCNVFVFKKKR